MINWNALAQLMQQGGKPGSPPNVFGGMPDYIAQASMAAPQQAGMGEGAPVDPNGMFAQQGGGGPKDLRRQSAPQPIEPEKIPWMQQKALGGFERGDLLLAGMGMLGGKNFKEGLSNASGVAFDAFGRQREEGEKKKQSEALVKAMVAKGVPLEEATAMAEFGPQVAFNDMYNTQANTYRDARDEKLDARYEAQWLQEKQRYETEQERLDRLEKYGIARDKVTDGQWQSEFGLREMEAAAKAAAGPEINVDDEGQFRREYNTVTKDFRDVQASYGRIKATDPYSPAGQVSLIYQFMKMLDPGSTVRETEAATAENARGVPDGVRNIWNKVMAGQPLTDAQVEDFLNQSDRLYAQSLSTYDTTRQIYEGIAGQYGFDAARTVPDLASMRPAPPVPDAVTAPEVGMEEDGFVYMGGNPADPNSWKKKEAGNDFRFFNNPGVR